MSWMLHHMPVKLMTVRGRVGVDVDVGVGVDLDVDVRA